jgi:plastocyanin
MPPSPSRQLLHKIALVAFVALLAAGIALRDGEALGFAVAVLAGILLLAFRTGLLGRIVLALVFLDTAVWMAPAALSNVQHHDPVAYTALPAVLGAVAVAGVLAAIGVRSRVLLVALIVAAVGAAGVAQVTTGDEVRRRPADLLLSAKNVRFNTDHVAISNVTGDPTIAVILTNHDLFWHTFTVDALHVDLRVPVGATRRVSFRAAPGEYEYYCRIPGHTAAGMKGVLQVR